MMPVERPAPDDEGNLAASGSTPAAMHFAIPPLSDARKTLLDLAEQDRLNLRVLELICVKDPGAVARIMAQAVTMPQTGALRTRRSESRQLNLPDALAAIGPRVAYDLLASMWQENVAHAPGVRDEVRSYLAKHIFLMLATARRVATHAEVGEEAPLEELLLLVLIDQMSLAQALTPDADPASQNALFEAIAAKRHAFHRITELEPLFRASRKLTAAWGLSDRLDGYLSTLGHWKLFASNLQPIVSVVLCSEAILEAASVPGFATFVREELPKVNPILRGLVSRGIDPVGLAPKY